MIFPNPYPPDLIRLCSHSVTLIPRVASTSLRRLGPFTKQTDKIVCIIRDPIDRWVSGYVHWLYTRARWVDNKVRWEAPHHLYYDVHTAPQWCQAPIRYSDTKFIRLEEINEYAERCKVLITHENHNSKSLSWCYEKTRTWIDTNVVWRESLIDFLHRDFILRQRCVPINSIPESWF